MTSKTNLEDHIREQRPTLSAPTVRTYASMVLNLYLRMLGGDSIPRVVKTNELVTYFTDKYKEVMEALKDVPYNRRKTVLASLLAVVPKKSEAMEKYREQMIADADKYNSEQRKQKKSPQQEDNWISQEDVIRRLQELEKSTKHLFTKQNLDMNELQQLQNYVILALYTMIPPRRILDFIKFKLRDIDKATDNYMIGNKFVFNTYKTKDKYGQQVVNIPVRLRNIIQKWAKKHDNDYLLFSERNTPLPQSRLTQKLNKIFGKNISVNMLRHIFISEKVLDATPALKQLEDVAEAMGHSVSTQQLYKKVD